MLAQSQSQTFPYVLYEALPTWDPLPPDLELYNLPIPRRDFQLTLDEGDLGIRNLLEHPEWLTPSMGTKQKKSRRSKRGARRRRRENNQAPNARLRTRSRTRATMAIVT
jgi:hypothetical protein